MPRVTYIEPTGSRVTIDAVVGDTVMSTAVDNNVVGIVGECGGGMSCATCHVFVTEETFDKVGPAEGYEAEMLETTAVPATGHSRLSCQLFVDTELDGLCVTIPERQQD